MHMHMHIHTHMHIYTQFCSQTYNFGVLPQLVVLTIGPHGRDVVDTSRLLCGTLFDNSSSVDVTASHACTSDDFPAVWFSYDYYDVSKERTQEELVEHYDFGQLNVVLCAELVHFWQHFSESRSSSLEANPSLSGGD